MVSCSLLMDLEEDASFGDLLRLRRSELKVLRSLIKSLGIPAEYGTVRRSTGDAFDRLLDIRPAEPLPKDELDFILDGIERAWNLLPFRPDIRCQVLTRDLWALACMSRGRNDSAAFDRVRALCEKLSNASSSLVEKRCLKEAMELPGGGRKKRKPAGSQPADFKPKHP